MQCSVSAHHLPTNHLQCLLYEQTTSTNNSGAILLQVLQSALRKKIKYFSLLSLRSANTAPKQRARVPVIKEAFFLQLSSDVLVKGLTHNSAHHFLLVLISSLAHRKEIPGHSLACMEISLTTNSICLHQDNSALLSLEGYVPFHITNLIPEIKKAHITIQGETFSLQERTSMCANNRTLKRTPSNISYVNKQF